jgi:hypothetical protein
MKEHCWAQGDIPADPALFASRLGYAEADVRAAWTEAVLRSFEPDPQQIDRLYCPELEPQREKLKAKTAALSAAGKAGADKRWSLSAAVATPIAPPMPNEVMKLNKERKGNLMTTPMATPLGSPSDDARQDETPEGTDRHERSALAEEEMGKIRGILGIQKSNSTK